MRDLKFSIDIAAPVSRVWVCMFDATAYRDWTSAFAEGSYYEGVWATGQCIRFLDPKGFGMEAVIDECLPYERLSLRLVGEIREGRSVADSRLFKKPAHERYAFKATPGDSTHLVIHLQSWDDGFTDFLDDRWPKALQRLKALAESTH